MINKEAIEQLRWVQKRICDITYSPEFFEAIELAIRALEERPKGEWIKIKDDRMSIDMSGELVTLYKCSKCERIIATFPSKLAKYYPFCHCGADMRGGATNE